METIVIGHKNPDMDSICAAIGYAELKRLQGVERVIAGRAGNLNARIEFVLKRFGMAEPVQFTDVTPLVRDVMVREVISARADATVTQAVGSIDEHQLRGLPVVDESNRCLGLLSTHKISHRIFPSRGDAERARRVMANLADVLQTFDGEVLVGEVRRDEEPREYHLTLSTMRVESFVQRLGTRAADRQVVFVGDREDVQHAANRHDQSAPIGSTSLRNRCSMRGRSGSLSGRCVKPITAPSACNFSVIAHAIE